MRSPKRLSAVAAIALSACIAGAQAPSCPAAAGEKPWLNPAYSPECRAQFVLGQVKTFDDKMAFLNSSGGGGGQNRDPKQRNVMDELGLKRGGRSDGPAGVRGLPGVVTAFPTPLTVAASFDPATATLFGDLLGQEFHAGGYSANLGPATDIARTWHFGRTTESFGEDPFLAASVVAPEIQAMQARHVIATVKHFTAYNQEQGRTGDQPTGVGPAVNQSISEKALREIYFPAFRSAITVGKAGSVMCSFPRLNGVYACENPYTLGVLKNEWKFDGSVGPDFPDAQRSIAKAFLAGLDEGVLMPPAAGAEPNAFTGEKSFKDAVQDGSFPMSRVDDMILRRLVSAFRVGVFDNYVVKQAGDITTPERRAAAVDVITHGAVLLKNNGVLPLTAGSKKIVVIGTQATDKAVVVEQGSPYVPAAHIAPVLAAVQQRAGAGVQVTFAAGTLGLEPLPTVPASMLKTPDGKPGVQVEYFANAKRDFSGRPLATRVQADFSHEGLPQIDGLPKYAKWSARFRATFTPQTTGVHHFTLNGSSEGVLYIDGRKMGEFLRADFQDTVYANVPLTAGKPIEIRVEYGARESLGDKKRLMFGINFGPYITLGWTAPNTLMQDAVQAARGADAAIVVVGHQVGEGMDRLSLALPSDQNDLIAAVAQANPHTVVVLNTGGAVAMPWLESVAAVLETWLPGDSTGPATAKLLFGDADPGGRLPVTFPADESQGPATRPEEYPGTTTADGALDTAHFSEGVFVGYRYWDQHGQKPLFPFGYGLSYARFDVKGLGVKPAGDGGAVVSVEVRNISKRAGSQVAQVYLGFPKAAGEPPRQLKGYGKVQLAAGESKTIDIPLPAAAFQSWDEGAHRWAVTPGAYGVMVGTSSRDIVWTSSFTPTGAGLVQ